MVYLLNMVDLSMAMLNDQMVYIYIIMILYICIYIYTPLHMNMYQLAYNMCPRDTSPKVAFGDSLLEIRFGDGVSSPKDHPPALTQSKMLNSHP
jgi:hypothetical protein